MTTTSAPQLHDVKARIPSCSCAVQRKHERRGRRHERCGRSVKNRLPLSMSIRSCCDSTFSSNRETSACRYRLESPRRCCSRACYSQASCTPRRMRAKASARKPNARAPAGRRARAGAGAVREWIDRSPTRPDRSRHVAPNEGTRPRAFRSESLPYRARARSVLHRGLYGWRRRSIVRARPSPPSTIQ